MSQQDNSVFDAVVGADQASLNSLIATFFAAAPRLFTQTFNVGQEGITTVGVQFAVAPTLTLTPTAEIQALAREFLTQHASGDELEQAISQLLDGLMSAQCKTVNVIVGGAKPVTVTAAIACTAGVAVNGAPTAPTLSIVLGDATITVPNEPTLSQALTEFAAPLLVAYLNQSVLAAIQIPMLSLLGIRFAPPVITDETSGTNTFLTAYTGLNPVTTPAAGIAWPTGVVFACADSAALNAVMNTVLPQPGGSGGIGTPNLSWDYKVSLQGGVQLDPSAGSNLSVNMNVGGGADITFHTPNWLPNISFGATFSGSLTASAILQIQQDGADQRFSIIITSAGNFNVSVDINGLPSIFSWLLSPVTDALLDLISPLITSILSNFPIHVYTLSPISISPGGISMKVTLNNLALTQVAGPDGVTMVMVTAQPTLASNAASAAKSSFTAAPGRLSGRLKQPVSARH
jgi:hypothetical protein